MGRDHDVADVIRAELLDAWIEDRDRGRTPELAAYLERFPGHDDVVRAEFDRLTRAATDRDGATRIGPYRLERILGEGGMGTVWLAEQEQPVRRTVAIKVVKPGMDSHAVLRRFDVERRALALMEHDGIARVLDAGTTPTGRAWFAMEHVDGQPITTYCDEHGLGQRERVELLLAVCAAVQHAHVKGILHRDLTPRNVLVTTVDGKPLPKVIDFGLARALDAVTMHSLAVTEFGILVGTPEYMSPEQTGLDDADVDTRTDVYGLGALLFELVTGAPPFDSETLRRASLDEMCRILREVEPPHLPTTERGDLDWIAQKALAKERDHRYTTAAELGADLRRFLDDEPVVARPPRARYRLAKFYRRNQLLVTAGVTLVAALLVGLVGTLLGYADAQRNLSTARSLAAIELARQGERTEADVYPPWPERLDRLREWLDLYPRALRDQLDELRATIRRLERRALPVTVAQREADRRAHADTQLLRQRREQAAGHMALLADPAKRDDPTVLEQLAITEARILAATSRLTELKIRRFESPDDDYVYRALTSRLGEIEHFLSSSGPTGRVERALAHAQRLRDAPRTHAWADVGSDLATSAIYAGVELTPQHDLLPLGFDPDTELLEFAHLPSGPPARRDTVTGRLRYEDDTGIVFVLLPGGRVRVGAQAAEPDAPFFDDLATGTGARMVVERTLEPFFLAKHELTQRQWFALSLSNRRPSHWELYNPYGDDPPVSERHPVESVSQVDAKRLLARFGLELPSEVQWEYAYRADTTTPWPGGGEGTVTIRANLGPEVGIDAFTNSCRVGSFPPNAFGLHDLDGNVGELCADRYGSYIFARAPRNAAQVDVDAEEAIVFRGASYGSGSPDFARSAVRFTYPPQGRSHFLGVRAARRIW